MCGHLCVCCDTRAMSNCVCVIPPELVFVVVFSFLVFFFQRLWCSILVGVTEFRHLPFSVYHFEQYMRKCSLFVSSVLFFFLANARVHKTNVHSSDVKFAPNRQRRRFGSFRKLLSFWSSRALYVFGLILFLAFLWHRHFVVFYRHKAKIETQRDAGKAFFLVHDVGGFLLFSMLFFRSLTNNEIKTNEARKKSEKNNFGKRQKVETSISSHRRRPTAFSTLSSSPTSNSRWSCNISRRRCIAQQMTCWT